MKLARHASPKTENGRITKKGVPDKRFKGVKRKTDEITKQEGEEPPNQKLKKVLKNDQEKGGQAMQVKPIQDHDQQRWAADPPVDETLFQEKAPNKVRVNVNSNEKTDKGSSQNHQPTPTSLIKHNNKNIREQSLSKSYHLNNQISKYDTPKNSNTSYGTLPDRARVNQDLTTITSVRQHESSNQNNPNGQSTPRSINRQITTRSTTPQGHLAESISTQGHLSDDDLSLPTSRNLISEINRADFYMEAPPGYSHLGPSITGPLPYRYQMNQDSIQLPSHGEPENYFTDCAYFDDYYSIPLSHNESNFSAVHQTPRVTPISTHSQFQRAPTPNARPLQFSPWP